AAPNVLAGPLPNDSAIYLKTGGPTPRRIRIPVTGNPSGCGSPKTGLSKRRGVSSAPNSRSHPPHPGCPPVPPPRHPPPPRPAARRAPRRGPLRAVLRSLPVGGAPPTGLLTACPHHAPDDPPAAGGGSSAPSDARPKLFAGWPAGRNPDVALILSGQQHSYLK